MMLSFLLAAGLTAAQVASIDASITASMAARHIPAAVVRIDRDGQTIYAKAFGYRDLPNRVPANVDTRFQYGSITKQFTAAAILKLMSDGKLSLDDRVGKYYPSFAKFPVTIRQVLIHTGGFADYTGEEWYFKRDFSNAFVGPEEELKWTASRPLGFTPGSKAVYDNAGYTLLARIVEKASGMTYFGYLKKSFLDPLGMTSVAPQSFFDDRPNTALGYMASDGDVAKALGLSPAAPVVSALAWNLRQADGAGFLVGDVADLQRWENGLLTHRVLHGAAEKLFYTPGKLANGEQAYTGPENPTTKARGSYCYGGLAQIVMDGVTVFGANGGTPGFLSFTASVPSKHIAISTLTNHGSDIDNSKFTTPILDAILK